MISIHYQKDLLIDIVIGLPILTKKKENSYDAILVIIDYLIKKIYYKLVKITINATGIAKVIINMVIRNYGFPNLIISDKSLLFTFKYYFSLYYFFGIKQRLFTTFFLQMDSQTKRQNSMIDVYLCTFVYQQQNNQAKLLLIAKFVYNNIKNTSTNHTLFELNYNYYLYIFFKNNTNIYLRSY